MKQGKSRFDIQISKVETLLNQASTQENPALWLFLHDLRTPIFMLEGLSKLYAKLHNEKTFKKLQDKFKQIEDVLGAVDYYAAFVKEFSAKGEIPPSVKNYLDSKTKEKMDSLNALLKKGDWLNGKQVKQVKAQLKAVDWKKEEKEANLITGFYLDEAKKIQKFVQKTTFTFDNIEEDVHELRRKLRWLSIYPQALQGLAQLEANKPTPKYLQKYLTNEIVSSPFNQLTPSKDLRYFLTFDKNHFLALSWMIAELGKIKDNGLKIKVLKDALQATDFLNDTLAMAKTYTLLGENYPKMEDLLNQASTITKQFMTENILTNLLKFKKDAQ